MTRRRIPRKHIDGSPYLRQAPTSRRIIEALVSEPTVLGAAEALGYWDHHGLRSRMRTVGIRFERCADFPLISTMAGRGATRDRQDAVEAPLSVSNHAP